MKRKNRKTIHEVMAKTSVKAFTWIKNNPSKYCIIPWEQDHPRGIVRSEKFILTGRGFCTVNPVSKKLMQYAISKGIHIEDLTK